MADHLPDEVAARADHHPHESPWTMTLPLVVLAGLSIGGGVLQLPFAKSLKFLEHWLEPSLFGNEVHPHLGAGTLWALAAIAVEWAVAMPALQAMAHTSDELCTLGSAMAAQCVAGIVRARFPATGGGATWCSTTIAKSADVPSDRSGASPRTGAPLRPTEVMRVVLWSTRA